MSRLSIDRVAEETGWGRIRLHEAYQCGAVS